MLKGRLELLNRPPAGHGRLAQRHAQGERNAEAFAAALADAGLSVSSAGWRWASMPRRTAAPCAARRAPSP
jgi:hypothetical protein